MTGIEIHANLKYNPDVEASDSGQMVKLRFGFSYDGLKAENMSIRYADENEEKNEITQERLKEGDYTEFCYKHILTSSKTGKGSKMPLRYQKQLKMSFFHLLN